MSDYTQTTDFSAKDALSTGDPNKLIKGSEVDAELAAISTAIATKYDSADLATQGQAQAGSDNTTLMTPLRVEEHVTTWAGENAGIVADLQALADPNADRLVMWDDSAGAAVLATLGDGLQVSATDISLDIANLTSETEIDGDADYVAMYDASAGAHRKVLVDDLWNTRILNAVKTTTESVTSSTTLQDDNQLLVSIPEAGYWAVEMHVYYDGNSGGDLKADFTFSGTMTTWGCFITAEDDAGTGAGEVQQTNALSDLFTHHGNSSGRHFTLVGLAQSAGSGTLQFRWAQLSSHATATRVITGSWLKLTRVDI